MAATNATSNPERNRGWYKEDVTEINAPMRELLEEYSKIPSNEAVTYDLRRLVLDGILSENLIGLDIEAPLIELGKDLFLNRSTLRSRFVVADVFKGASQGEAWTQLSEGGGFDVVHCSAFSHLFTLPDQIAAAEQIAPLLKKGGLLVGRQSGSIRPGNLAAIDEGSFSYRHDVGSLAAMWDKVGAATGTGWEVTGLLDMVGMDPDSPVENADSRRLLFTITRVR
ncbi:hypothetical protein PG996_010603 [Apiospora saccharicola]|uniref:Methyltransferase type 11 domain-containing protein n=1 Tax=Apiospora saccharicola TaxID=335842 RepID=A0ABR1UP19_9PEZI